MKKFLFFIFLSLAVSALATDRYYLPVQVMRSGTFTLPDSIHSILIINNGAIQPETYGHQVRHAGQETMNIKQELDSAAFFCLLSVDELLEQTEQFDEVTIQPNTVDTIGKFFELHHLTSEQAKLLCEDYGADAVLALDRIVIASIESTVIDDYDTYTAAIDLQSGATWSVYYSGDGYKRHSTTIKDTLSWEKSDDNESVALSALPTTAAACAEAAVDAGEKAVRTLFNHWVTEDRFFFEDKKTKEGMDLFRQHRFEEAIQNWTALIKMGNNTVRANASANIAVALELLGDTTQATAFAKQAYNCFINSNSMSSTEGAAIMKQYIRQLQHVGK